MTQRRIDVSADWIVERLDGRTGSKAGKQCANPGS